MKTPFLSTLLALALASATVHAQDTPPAPPTPPATPAEPKPPKPGKAIITIEVGGHQKTNELEISDAKSTQIFVGKPGKNQTTEITTDGSMTARHEKTAWLGITPDEVPESLRSQLSLAPDSGLLLRSVVPDSPAAKAGLQKNDVLTMLDNQLLLSEHQLHGLLKAKHDGDIVHLAYVRHGQPGMTEVKLGLYESPVGNGDGSDPDDTDGSNVGEQISKDVNAVVRSALKNAATNLAIQSKAIVLDKAGKMVNLISDDMPDLATTLDAVDKSMRKAGIDEKTIADTKQRIADTLQRNQHGLEKAQEGLKKAAEGLKKAAAAQAKAAGQTDDEDND